MSQTCNNNATRITEETDYSKPFEVPNHILKKREQFWNDSFCKYSTNTLDDTEMDIVTLKPHVLDNESLQLIQYWINTGYLPYTKQRFHVDGDNQSDTRSLSISEKCSRLSHPRVEKRSDTEYVQPRCTDTNAYILSNMNTANKEESMNIIEGAKQNIVVSCSNASPMKITQFNPEKICEESNQNIELNGNNYNYQQDSPKTYEASKFMLQQKNTDSKENLIQAQMNPNMNVNKSTLLEKNKDNDLLTNCESDNKFCEMLTDVFNNNQNINSYIKQNSLSTKAFRRITEGNFISQCNSETKAKHRKSLYINRESPVDLIAMEIYDNSIMDKSKQNLHPALKCQCDTSEKRRRKTRKLNFSRISRNSKVSTKNGTLSINGTTNSVINQYSSEYNTDQHSNSFVSINRSTNKNNKSTNHSEKTNVNKCTVPADVTESFNLTVHVKLSPKKDTLSINGTKNSITNHYSSEYNTNQHPISFLSINQSTNKNNKFNKSTNHSEEKYANKCTVPVDITENFNLTVQVKLSPKNDLEKCTKSKEIEKHCLKNMNPIVLLERLSTLEIEKYTRSKKIMKSNLESIDPVLSKFGNQKHKNTRNRKAFGKNDANSDQVPNKVSVSDKSNSLLTKINLSNKDDGCNRYSLATSKRNSMSSVDYLKSEFFDFRDGFYESPESSETEEKDNRKKRKLNDDVINKEMKTVHQNINNSVLLSKKSEKICKNSRKDNSDNVYTNNDEKKSLDWLEFDDDKEFDEMLNKNFNILTEKLNNVMFDKLYNKMKCSQKTEKTAIKSTNDQLPSKFITKDSGLGSQEQNLNPMKSQGSLQRCNLSTKGNDKQTINETTPVIKNQLKTLTDVNIVQDESLCFRTRIFETDSDSD